MTAGAREGASDAVPEVTGRALATGLSVGVLLAVANVTMGLKTGWWDTGHVTASALGVALALGLARRRVLGAGEAATIVSTATAAGAAPATLGLMGAIPALTQLGRPPPLTAVAALGLALAVLAILAALGLRRRLLEVERLPFPTGAAAAEVVSALRGGADRRPARALTASALLAGGFTAARDLARLFPPVLPLPGTILGTPASALGLGVAAYPLLAGAGMLAGLRNGLSIALGAAIAWGLVAPRLVTSGEVPSAGFAALAGWLAWPGVALVLGAGVVSLSRQWRAFAAAARDLGGVHRPRSLAGALLALAAAAAAVAAVSAGMGVPPLRAAAALALGLALALVCARAAGQTDILAAGEVAHVAQVALGPAGGAAVNAAGAGLTAGLAAQLGVSLQSLRAAGALRAAPAGQGRALLAGALAGAAVSIPLYAATVAAHGLGTAELPVPAAVPWRAVAGLVERGAAALPPSTVAATAAALAAGVALELLAPRVRWLPSPGALGMGFIAPAHFAATLLLGASAAALWRRLAPRSADALLASAASGLIAGESVLAVIALALG